MLLFTENGSVQSIQDGILGAKFTGREKIGKAFKVFLSQFEVVYHISGQQTVNIAGDTADGINYCQVVLIKEDNGKKIKRTSGVRYQDKYRKIDGKWYIENRVSNFMWTTTEEMK